MNAIRRLAFGALLVVAAPSNAPGSLTFYSDRSAFELATLDLVTVDFEGQTFSGGANSILDHTDVGNGLPAGWIPIGIQFENPSTFPTSDFILWNEGDGGVPSDSLSAATTGGVRILLGPEVTAVGLDLALHNGSSGFLDGDINVALSNSQMFLQNHTFSASAGGPMFFGVIATDGDTLGAVGLNDLGDYYEWIDNVSFGTAVPEPRASVLLIVAAITAAILSLRRILRAAPR